MLYAGCQKFQTENLDSILDYVIKPRLGRESEDEE